MNEYNTMIGEKSCFCCPMMARDPERVVVKYMPAQEELKLYTRRAGLLAVICVFRRDECYRYNVGNVREYPPVFVLSENRRCPNPWACSPRADLPTFASPARSNRRRLLLFSVTLTSWSGRPKEKTSVWNPCPTAISDWTKWSPRTWWPTNTTERPAASWDSNRRRSR